MASDLPPSITTEMTAAIENCRDRKLEKCVTHIPETEKFKRTQGKSEGTPYSSGGNLESAREELRAPLSAVCLFQLTVESPQARTAGREDAAKSSPATRDCPRKARFRPLLKLYIMCLLFEKLIFNIYIEISNCINS